MNNLDTCLTSKEIKQLVENGSLISPNFDKKRVQPSSFEPAIGDELFILDTEGGLFRPQEDQQVYRTLLGLPRPQREMVNISGGFEVRRGYSYLIKLQEQIKENFNVGFVLSSPKSSIGRTFLNTRLLADYNASFDEIQRFPTKNPLDLWLLFQPLAFNAIIGPGLTLNQLRFFTGPGAGLSLKEILEEWKTHPLLFSRDKDQQLIPIKSPIITSSLQLHLDLKGEGTHGIVALRARQNPTPIDLRGE